MIVSGKKLNWKSWKHYASPQGIKDFDKFLDSVPSNVGYNALIAVGLAWLIAGASALFTTMELEKVTKMHAELMQVQALQPPIPELNYIPVSANVLKPFAKKIEDTYKGVGVSISGDGAATVSAPDTDYFPQFLAAISYLQRGGKNWKVKISTLCVGRGCQTQKLTATLAIETLRIGEPKDVGQAAQASQEEAPVAVKKKPGKSVSN